MKIDIGINEKHRRQRARQQLATLDSGTRLVRVDGQGERVVLDDAARANEAALARRVIASDCR